jgi:hypothetical protein
MFHHQKAGRNCKIKPVSKSLKNTANLKYLGTTVTNQNCIHKEIKSRLNSENACCNSVQNILCSHPFSKHIKIKIYRAIILPSVWYGGEAWSLTLTKEQQLRKQC